MLQPKAPAEWGAWITIAAETFIGGNLPAMKCRAEGLKQAWLRVHKLAVTLQALGMA